MDTSQNNILEYFLNVQATVNWENTGNLSHEITARENFPISSIIHCAEFLVRIIKNLETIHAQTGTTLKCRSMFYMESSFRLVACNIRNGSSSDDN